MQDHVEKRRTFEVRHSEQTRNATIVARVDADIGNAAKSPAS